MGICLHLADFKKLSTKDEHVDFNRRSGCFVCSVLHDIDNSLLTPVRMKLRWMLQWYWKGLELWLCQEICVRERDDPGTSPLLATTPATNYIPPTEPTETDQVRRPKDAPMTSAPYRGFTIMFATETRSPQRSFLFARKKSCCIISVTTAPLGVLLEINDILKWLATFI